MSFPECNWINPPSKWSLNGDCLRVTTDAATDFWCETHYGFTRDNGHFFGSSVVNAFTAQLRVRAKYEELYDQAGIMIRIDDRRWVKAGIENSNGENLLSSVLTIERSDWASGAYGHDSSNFWLRATVSAGVLKLQVSPDGQRWPVFRLAPFPEASTYLVGPMCCTPERAGLEIEFSEFQIGPPMGKDLHDLS
jgi:uncharacterized protein